MIDDTFFYYNYNEQLANKVANIEMPSELKDKLVQAIKDYDDSILSKMAEEDEYKSHAHTAQSVIYVHLGQALHNDKSIYEDITKLLLAGIYCKLNNIDYKFYQMMNQEAK